MKPQPLEKDPSGIPGLDNVLKGGFPRNRVSVIKGSHGTGKTVIGLNFLTQNALEGKAGVFVSFEETVDSLRRNASAMGWDLKRLEDQGLLAFLSFEVTPNLVLAGDFDISATVAIIREKLESMGARHCVIDASDWLLALFPTHEDRKSHLLQFQKALTEVGVTTLFTVKDNWEESDILDYLCDCAVRLDSRTDRQISVRRLQVTKYRGSSYLPNEHPFIIDEKGPRLVPVSGMTLDHEASTEHVSSGNQQLDSLLGGGYFKGGATIIAGASGTGKTTLLSSFAESVCARGDRVLYLSFEESVKSLAKTMESPGINLATHIDNGNLRVESSFPESKGTDEQLIDLTDTIREYNPDHICIDPISATARMGSAKAAFDFQIRLIYHCKQKGISCLASIQSKTDHVAREMGRLELASVAETVIGLEQIDSTEVATRTITIVKSRATVHPMGGNGFMITDNGLTFDANARSFYKHSSN